MDLLLGAGHLSLMALMDNEITSRVRIKDGSIYDIRCVFESEHDNIFVSVIHDSPIEEEYFHVPIKFTHRWATFRPETFIG